MERAGERTGIHEHDEGVAGQQSGEYGERKSNDGMLFELARKAMSTSVTRILETEGFVREMVKAVTREVAGYVIREIGGLRQEAIEQGGKQFGAWLDRIDIGAEARKALDGMTFDVSLKVTVTDGKIVRDVQQGKGDAGVSPAPVRKPVSSRRKSAAAAGSAKSGSKGRSSKAGSKSTRKPPQA